MSRTPKACAVTWFTPRTIATLRVSIESTREAARKEPAHYATALFHANWMETALDAIEHLKRRPRRNR